MLIAPITIPQIIVAIIRSEKIFCAFSFFPSPMILAINALPPVPNINPITPVIIRNGMIKFTAANDVFPTKI